MKARGNRDEIVLATKYTTMYDASAKDKANKLGNSYKSMYMSIENSLKNLQTSYVDILYLHWYVRRALQLMLSAQDPNLAYY